MAEALVIAKSRRRVERKNAVLEIGKKAFDARSLATLKHPAPINYDQLAILCCLRLSALGLGNRFTTPLAPQCLIVGPREKNGSARCQAKLAKALAATIQFSC